ncbi:transglutaminase-like cysteine peptidase [Nitratireductor indicus]|uniref:Transglutaminase n=1 Tax=Nitratireductor indicus C115 TaxID=1231190 RepID=K2NTU7_9HYPH|nr:transglutaminase-like cysteine peptidase [Nitratireductor indicus]EKF42720.1 transglutaminase [Nitratireductor indicus C115]MDS1134913.1 transglutaminase-like cysteine peptidase [Nitratireductor indicus]SFQ39286.1 Predicted transglutaminase-like cysteine proteinase [Nitratireductor indicus]
MGTSKLLRLTVGAAAIFAAFGASANATPNFMKTEGLTTQPIGHYELCQRSPSECRQTASSPRRVALSRALWKTLIDVNNAVNTAVIPRTDQEMWGVEEFWSYPDGYGDCEDYVLEKRRLLIKAGVPASNLLITVVRQPNGDGHAVLTVVTDLGDYILDNLEGRVLLWSDTAYTYLKRQSAMNSGKWVSVNDGRAVAVGSVGTAR